MTSSDRLSTANGCFALALFKKLGDENKTANVFFSPLSISAALAMVLLGAKGNTATQMSEVLCLPEAEQPKPGEAQEAQPMQQQSLMQSRMGTQRQVQMQVPQSRLLEMCLKPQTGQEDVQTGQEDVQTGESVADVHSEFAKLLAELNRPDAPYALSLANKLYGEQSFQFVSDFLEETKKYYKAELESVDFVSSSEGARIRINTWVEKQTRNKIKDALAPGVVDSLTVLVLVNAIYFKGNWNQMFKEDSTVDEEFKLNKNETKPVKMMYQTAKFHHTHISEVACQILELPYETKDLSMLIILPTDELDDTTGLEKLEKELTYEKFEEWTHPKRMKETKVKVGLPRFKMEETYDLNKVLISMGMVDAFNVELSDFSGISTKKKLEVSKVVHKAYVEVNEKGTEAAAATVIAIGTTSVPLPPPQFIADRPFLFFIRHNRSKNILFAGRFSSPE